MRCFSEGLVAETCVPALPCLVQVLCIQGFLTCRKQSERILLLVEMMQVSYGEEFSVASSPLVHGCVD